MHFNELKAGKTYQANGLPLIRGRFNRVTVEYISGDYVRLECFNSFHPDMPHKFYRIHRFDYLDGGWNIAILGEVK